MWLNMVVIAINIVIAIAVVIVTVHTLQTLKIRLSLLQMVGYYLNLIGLVMRIIYGLV